MVVLAKDAHHRVYSLNDHLVLVTKYRRRMLTVDMLTRFGMLAAERCNAWGGRMLECNDELDYVHLLVTLPPTTALSEFVNALKTGTSRRLRAEFPDEVKRWDSKPALWSRSYCVMSVGGAPLEVLKRYIKGQAGAGA